MNRFDAPAVGALLMIGAALLRTLRFRNQPELRRLAFSAPEKAVAFPLGLGIIAVALLAFFGVLPIAQVKLSVDIATALFCLWMALRFLLLPPR